MSNVAVQSRSAQKKPLFVPAFSINFLTEVTKPFAVLVAAALQQLTICVDIFLASLQMANGIFVCSCERPITGYAPCS